MPLQEELEKQGNFLFKYRGSLPILILIAALCVFAYQVKTQSFPTYYQYLCFAVSCFGLLIRVYAVGHTPKNTSGRNTKEQIADEINTTGIYSTVRHPLYVGNFFMWLGAALLTYHLWFILFFIAFYWLYYERIMFAEEQFLRKKFGDSYLVWASKTPAFIPAFSHFQKPKYPFSFKKIIRKEVNGILNIFIVFALFDAVSYFIMNKSLGISDFFWISGVCITLIFYLILKVLSKSTNLLHDAERI